jgi:hypothetical protein
VPVEVELPVTVVLSAYAAASSLGGGAGEPHDVIGIPDAHSAAAQ